MRYLPHTSEDVASMLEVVEKGNLEDLFTIVPEECRCKDSLDIPKALTEWELREHVMSLSENTGALPKRSVFLGAGSYDHYIPEAASYLLSRSEFVTSYTPYQPEMSQGTLQAIFEYQTLVTRLLGMEVANASLYDGASALAEALLMAVRATRRKKLAVSKAIHPHYRRVIQTYLHPTDCELVELSYAEDGRTDFSTLNKIDGLAGVAIQSPNFFGCIEDIGGIAQEVHNQAALLITGFTEPLAYGLLSSPGQQGADIACGEGQSLGIPQSFGGPGLGMFAAKSKHMRAMPGRLVGKATDRDGRQGFVLTLATREQHIRREKATSNICTNSSLCALATTMYLALLGGTGMRKLARLNYDKCEYLKGQFEKAGCSIPFSSPTFNEFVVEFPPGFDRTYERLLKQGIVAGLPLNTFFPKLKNHYLLCVTETKSKNDMEMLVNEVVS